MPPDPPAKPPSARSPATHDPAPGIVADGIAAAPHPAVRRLSLYLRQLEAFEAQGRHTASSRDLGRALDLGDAQVRKDLANFGSFGQPGVGYRVAELIDHLRKILGTDRTWDVVLVGAGNIGRALLAYRRFAGKGFRLGAVFDTDPKLHGQSFSGTTVQPVERIPRVVRETKIRLAILAVPAEAAQRSAELLVDAGILGILNFAPVRLQVPAHVYVNSVDLAVQLEQIAFQVNETEKA